MKTEIIPLSDRLARLRDGEAAHPEYDGAVIRSLARMPIMSYLGDYHTFCDLQSYLAIRQDLPYQITARVTNDLLWKKQLKAAEVSDIVNILAAPIVQIQRAYSERNSAFLPYREPERAVFRVERLSRRIEHAKALAGPPYAFHCLPTRRFFGAVSKITGAPGFLDAFQTRILPQILNDRAMFREAVYAVNGLDTQDRTVLLYKLLIEPFAALPHEESEVT